MADWTAMIRLREEALQSTGKDSRAEPVIRLVELLLTVEALKDLDVDTSHGTIAFLRPGATTFVGVSSSATDPAAYDVQCSPFGPSFLGIALDRVVGAIAECVKYADVAPPIPPVKISDEDIKNWGLGDLLRPGPDGLSGFRGDS